MKLLKEELYSISLDTVLQSLVVLGRNDSLYSFVREHNSLGIITSCIKCYIYRSFCMWKIRYTGVLPKYFSNNWTSRWSCLRFDTIVTPSLFLLKKWLESHSNTSFAIRAPSNWMFSIFWLRYSNILSDVKSAYTKVVLTKQSYIFRKQFLSNINLTLPISPIFWWNFVLSECTFHDRLQLKITPMCLCDSSSLRWTSSTIIEEWKDFLILLEMVIHLVLDCLKEISHFRPFINFSKVDAK